MSEIQRSSNLTPYTSRDCFTAASMILRQAQDDRMVELSNQARLFDGSFHEAGKHKDKVPSTGPLAALGLRPSTSSGERQDIRVFSPQCPLPLITVKPIWTA
jgi:hypothetical protein